MKLFPIPSTAQNAAVGAASAAIGNGAMAIGEMWQLVTTTPSYFKQGTQQRITCVAKANLVDGETVTIEVFSQKTSREMSDPYTAKSAVKVYELDVNGTGVTAGNVQVNVSADVTNINVAARLAAAITANNPELTVVDNLNGTLDVYAPSRQMSITEQVANAGFTVADQALTAAAAVGNMILAPSLPYLVDGAFGKQAAIIRVAADGNATLTRVTVENG